MNLLAIEEIRRLKARNFRVLDTTYRDGFAAVFTPDTVLDSRPDDHRCRNHPTTDELRAGDLHVAIPRDN